MEKKLIRVGYTLVGLNILFWLIYFPLLIIYPYDGLLLNLLSYVFGLLLFSLIAYISVLILYPILKNINKLRKFEKNFLLFYLIGISIFIFTLIYFALADWASEFWLIFPILGIALVLFNVFSIIILIILKNKNPKTP
jgi:hypothetical protein